jgi:hypothetical protein
MSFRTACTAVLSIALVLFASIVLAYPDASGCRSCHPTFEGGPGNALHNLHVSTDLTSNCLLCHTSTGDVPDINDSPEGGSCTGCHVANGLWQHHLANSISCAPCHSSWSTPAPEDTPPPYYGRADVGVSDPCKTDPASGGEDWDGDGKGLDNDGDNLYEAADSDCGSTPIENTTWGMIKALYSE